MFGPLGSAVLSLSNPKALASSAGAPGSNTRLQTVKLYPITVRTPHGNAAIHFTRKETRKRHFPLTFRPILFIQQFVSHLVSQHVYKCVLLIDHIRTALSALGGLLQNISYPPTFLLIHWTVCPLHVLLKSKSKNTKTRRQNMTTTHSGTVTNEQKTTWPQALSSILERLMSVPEDPKLK